MKQISLIYHHHEGFFLSFLEENDEFCGHCDDSGCLSFTSSDFNTQFSASSVSRVVSTRGAIPVKSFFSAWRDLLIFASCGRA